MVLIVACVGITFVALQVFALVRLRQKMLRAAAIACAVVMVTVVGVSLALLIDGSNLAPLLVVFSLPAAIAYLGALLIIDTRVGRSGPRN